jgi:rubredoxin
MVHMSTLREGNLLARMKGDNVDEREKVERRSKLHAVRFRCHKCHYAYNEKHPEWEVTEVRPGFYQFEVDVTCPRCKEVHTIPLRGVFIGRAE